MSRIGKLPVPVPSGVDVTIDVVPDLERAVQEADVVVLLQKHADYALGELADASAVLLDTRGVVGPHPRVEVL